MTDEDRDDEYSTAIREWAKSKPYKVRDRAGEMVHCRNSKSSLAWLARRTTPLDCSTLHRRWRASLCGSMTNAGMSMRRPRRVGRVCEIWSRG